MGRIGRFLDRWGYYFLAILCAAAILLSALWTNRQHRQEEMHAPAAVDESQRLAEAKEEQGFLQWPAGEMLRPFSAEPVYFEHLNLWQPHMGVDFYAEDGERVLAMADGRVQLLNHSLQILHLDDRISIYRGLKEIMVEDGQWVEAGEALGTAGGKVPYEGEHLCVQMKQGEIMMDFSWELIPANE